MSRPTKIVKMALGLSLILFLAGCGAPSVRKVPPDWGDRKIYRPQLLPSSPVLEAVPADKLPPLADDLDVPSLHLAIERSLEYFQRLRERDTYLLGTRQVTVKEMKETLRAFREIIAGSEPPGTKEKMIRETFAFYRAVGDDGRGRVIFTGYYEPLLEGSFQKSARYRFPLYRVPEETALFMPPDGRERSKHDRLVGRAYNGNIVPHYKRAEIDTGGALNGRNLELIYVADPVELFFLHIQGSGKIRLPEGRIVQVGYAQNNGHPYRSIGNYLLGKGKLSKKDTSQGAIKKYLREHPEETASILNHNERYVFFRLLSEGPVGALNVPVTAGRTIASDPALFPQGALAFIKLRKPLINNGNILSWEPFTRYVLNQDTGGAITGAGRIDLFCGGGPEAEVMAGSLKERGELYFLIKK